MVDFNISPRVAVVSSLLQVERVVFIGLSCWASNQPVKNGRIAFDSRTIVISKWLALDSTETKCTRHATNTKTQIKKHTQHKLRRSQTHTPTHTHAEKSNKSNDNRRLHLDGRTKCVGWTFLSSTLSSNVMYRIARALVTDYMTPLNSQGRSELFSEWGLSMRFLRESDRNDSTDVRATVS